MPAELAGQERILVQRLYAFMDEDRRECINGFHDQAADVEAAGFESAREVGKSAAEAPGVVAPQAQPNLGAVGVGRVGEVDLDILDAGAPGVGRQADAGPRRSPAEEGLGPLEVSLDRLPSNPTIMVLRPEWLSETPE
ncbi:MAG: hypothetical protein AAFX50_20185 [Acidobacteriota bacterium]